MNHFPEFVKIVEVGPRDGLQNESQLIDTPQKLQLIQKLSQTGLQYIEATSFVSPKKIPQLSDSKKVFESIMQSVVLKHPFEALHAAPMHYSAIVPNLEGAKSALDAGVTELSVLTTASESFCKNNINCSISDSLSRIQDIIKYCPKHITFRGYVSCVVACPFEGFIAPKYTRPLVQKLFELGCSEISLGETIGVATPNQILDLLHDLKKHHVPLNKIALHLHNTYGQALASIYAALQMGIYIFDSSIAGLGGCPYAPGASGNIATEDLVYLLNGLGISHGVDLIKLLEVSELCVHLLNRPPRSAVAQAMLNTRPTTHSDPHEPIKT